MLLQCDRIPLWIDACQLQTRRPPTMGVFHPLLASCRSRVSWRFGCLWGLRVLPSVFALTRP